MGARRTFGTRWFIATALEAAIERRSELVKAAARASYEQACREWHGQQQARLARAIVVAKRGETPRILRIIEAFARIFTG